MEKLIERQHKTIVFLKNELIEKNQDIKLIKKELSQSKRFVNKSDSLVKYERELI